MFATVRTHWPLFTQFSIKKAVFTTNCSIAVNSYAIGTGSARSAGEGEAAAGFGSPACSADQVLPFAKAASW